MRFDVITLFPEIFSGYLSQSLLNKAIARGLVSVHLHDLRAWSNDKHNKVDDRPYGGGPGMLIRVEPVVDCVEAVQKLESIPGKLILLTPQGERLKQSVVSTLAEYPRLILLCGRYEGFDHRVVEYLCPMELSIGDFVLNGGEVAAMAVIEATMRLIPDVLGDERSSQDDSFSGSDSIECPQYTRPREFRGLEVPEVLFNGNHKAIVQWREKQSQERTKQRETDA